MCILSYLPPNVPVEAPDLLNGGLLNPDGHGWAIAVEGRIIMGKSMKVEKALDEFVDARERYPHGHALFHSRWATHGSVTTFNVHPFLVGKSHQTVMAHNGILSCTPKKGDARSDTQLFADDILPTFYKRLDKPRAFDALSKFCGKFNKLVILTVDPRYEKNAYLVNEKAGHWDSFTGIWHSNYDYLGNSYQWGSKGTTTTVGKAEPKPSDCVLCNGPVDSAGFCDWCGSCEDCLDSRNDCQCWLRYADLCKDGADK